MPGGFYGREWHKVYPCAFRKNFANQNFSPEVGNGTLSFLKIDDTAATVRTATKKCTVLNGSSQYWSKSSPSNLDMNGSELISSNPGFEDGTTAGWTIDDNNGTDVTPSVDTVIKHSGSYSGKITVVTAGSGTARAYRTITHGLSAGDLFTQEIWVYVPAANTAKSVIFTAKNVQDSFATIVTTTSVIAGDTWQKLVLNGVIPSGCTSIQLFVSLIQTLANGDILYLDDASLTQAYDFTVLAWCKTSSTGAVKKIVSRISATQQIILQITSANVIGGIVRSHSGDAVNLSGATTITDGQWHLAALTADRNGNLVLYVDGVADSSGSISGVGSIVLSSPLSVGRNAASDIEYFQGSIGELQILRGYALTAEEVAYAYTYGIPDCWHSGTVVAHYKWDSNGTDETGNNTLTNNGSATLSTGTYNQYATWNSDGSFRAWGNYCVYTNLPTLAENLSVLCDNSMHKIYNSSFPYGISWLMTQSGAQGMFSGYYQPSGVFLFTFGTAESAYVGTSYSSTASLEQRKRVAVSHNYDSDIYTTYINGVSIGSSTSASTPGTLSGTIQIPYAGNKCPVDVYKIAFFRNAFDNHQMLSIDNAYSHVY